MCFGLFSHVMCRSLIFSYSEPHRRQVSTLTLADADVLNSNIFIFYVFLYIFFLFRYLIFFSIFSSISSSIHIPQSILFRNFTNANLGFGYKCSHWCFADADIRYITNFVLTYPILIHVPNFYNLPRRLMKADSFEHR